MMHGYTFGIMHPLWTLLIALLIVAPAWRICERAGYSGWLGLLAVVPFVNLALPLFPRLRRVADGPSPTLITIPVVEHAGPSAVASHR